MSSQAHKPIVVRMAPSPTGFLHVGTARTALYNYLFAKKLGGKYLLRIEDTDLERSKKEYEVDILDNLGWLGITHDELYRQSDRTGVYKAYLKKLVESGAAYISKEEPKEEGQRSEVIRFRNPNKNITFTDLIRGEITFNTADLGDFIIAKSLEEPLYHLAVVIDDHEMGITHIIRGEDHISNTPRQILIQEAIGGERPVYAHLPLILAPDKSKLSKRKHGETVSLNYYRQQGYLPQAMVNFLALLGWNPGGEQEIFSIAELIEKFEISRVQKGGAIFNIEKLNWINREYIRRLPKSLLLQTLKDALSDTPIDPTVLERALPELLERISKLADFKTMKGGGELDYLYTLPTYDAHSLVWKNKSSLEETKTHLQFAIEQISGLNAENFSQESIKQVLWKYAESKGKGNVLWPIRYALSGKEKSPDPFSLASILGKEETLKRLRHAVEII